MPGQSGRHVSPLSFVMLRLEHPSVARRVYCFVLRRSKSTAFFSVSADEPEFPFGPLRFVPGMYFEENWR